MYVHMYTYMYTGTGTTYMYLHRKAQPGITGFNTCHVNLPSTSKYLLYTTLTGTTLHTCTTCPAQDTYIIHYMYIIKNNLFIF